MAFSEDFPSRCLLIGNSRWHWAEQSGTSRWVYQHEVAAPEALDSPSDLMAWAAVGPIPQHPCLQSSRRLNLADIPLQGIPPWLGIDRALAGWGAWRANETHVGVLVVDAGTVLSLTRISATGSFSGGLLAAGYGLQLRAMAEATAGLNVTSPVGLDPEDAKPFPSRPKRRCALARNKVWWVLSVKLMPKALGRFGFVEEMLPNYSEPSGAVGDRGVSCTELGDGGDGRAGQLMPRSLRT